MTPDSIGGYSVVRPLGAGGMGEVYLVQHPRLPRQDALKLLHGTVATDADAKARFLREAEVLSALSHPNIVHLYDRGEDDGRLWLTMEYIDGPDAARLLREHGPMPVDLALRIVDGVGSALDYGHRVRGVTHRDVKPANILIGYEGGAPSSVKLTDFGIAKALENTAVTSAGLTSTGLAMGTMTYLAPEAIEGGTVDHRSDQYSLACTAFELLTGAPPYPRESARTVAAAHLSAPIPRISERAGQFGPAADAVFARALAKEPGDRYPTNADFGDALRSALTATSAAPIPPFTPVPQFTPPALGGLGPRRRRGLLIGGALAATVLIGAGAAAAVFLTRGSGSMSSAPTVPPPYTGPTVACTYADKGDQAAAARKSVEDMKVQIAKAKAQLATLSSEQRTMLQEQITSAEARNTETEKQLPLLEKVNDRNKSLTKPAEVNVPSIGTLTGTIATNQGVVGFELDRSKAPCNVQTFATLMQAKYFDNTTCHRETASESADKKGGLFVIQCGDPSGTGLGGASWTSPDETPSFLKAAAAAAVPAQAGAAPSVIYPAGTIAVANANAPQQGRSNTGSSQFFLVYKDTTLPADYSVIGKTDDAGLTVLQQIAEKGIKTKAGATAPKPGQPVTDGEPIQPVNIATMALTQ